MLGNPTPDENRAGAGSTGLASEGRTLVSDLAHFAELRLELAAIEGREAAGTIGKAVAWALLAGVFLLVADLMIAAALTGILTRALSKIWPGCSWEVVALAIALAHVLAAWLAIRSTRSRFSDPVMPETLDQFKKDQAWLAAHKRPPEN